MTRLLLIFDASSFLTLDVPQPATALAEEINRGLWRYPAPIDKLLSENPALIFRAVALGSWVFATCDNGDLPRVPIKNELLSPRQVEILNLFSDGLTNKQISQKLGLSPRTVNLHINAIKSKLGTQTIAQSVSRGAALGYCRQFQGRE